MAVAGFGGAGGAMWNGAYTPVSPMKEAKLSNLEKAKKALYNKRGEMPKVKMSNLEAAKMALQIKTHVSAYRSMSTMGIAYNPGMYDPYAPEKAKFDKQEEERSKLISQLIKGAQWDY